ncbi:MAG TPA: shikimate dehydrogenase [Gemmatimonadaceae bacterium]
MPPSRLVLVGHPVAHSLSPRIHNAALHAAGIPLIYTVMDVPPDQLRRVMRQLRAEDAAGNVTIPHKQAVFDLCDHRTHVAERAGAVNTFWMQDGELIGDNTDVAGFDFAARELMESVEGDHMPERVAIIGAGGASAAVATAIQAWDGTEVVIWSRNPAQAEKLSQRFERTRAEANLACAVKGADFVVNATPMGLLNDQLPVPIEDLPRKCPVLDLVCVNGETAWVRAARDAGHPASDGQPMLVEQAARSFRRWLNVEPNREVMWGALR